MKNWDLWKTQQALLQKYEQQNSKENKTNYKSSGRGNQKSLQESQEAIS